ncbi:MAG: TlpA disulfide reductase family protein [Pseudomonadota bacterium]
MGRRLLISLIVSLGLYNGVWAATPGEVAEGTALRDLMLYGFAGDNRKLSELRGKPLIINVWASWCGPCRSEMDSLSRLAKRYNGKQFNIIGISTDDDGEAALKFIMQTNIMFANYLDYKVTWENMLGANTIPLTILVDAKGKVLKKVRGARQWDSQESLTLIGKTLGVKL